MARYSKSPRKVMILAQAAMPAYAHRFAPKKYTQHQLFACLVLKIHQKKDYRGLWQLLNDCPDLRACIGLKDMPHYATLQKAMKRLLDSEQVGKLIQATLNHINGKHLDAPSSTQLLIRRASTRITPAATSSGVRIAPRAVKHGRNASSTHALAS